MSVEEHLLPDAKRVLPGLGFATLVVTMAVLILAAVSIPLMWETQSDTDAVRLDQEVQACEARLRTDVVLASAAVATAKSRLELITSESLEAAARDDDETMAAVMAGAADARSAVSRALVELDRTVAVLDEQSTLAATDRTAFLAGCRD